MAAFRFSSKIEQLAGYLKAEIASGRWRDVMPGRMELAVEFGVNERTVEESLRLLEREGILVPQGAGRRRLIALPTDQGAPLGKFKILVLERIDQSLPLQLGMIQSMREAGHSVTFAEESLQDLGLNVKRIAAYVKADGGRAWIVCSAPREILEWFATQELSVFAVFGKLTSLPLSGVTVEKITAIRRVVNRLREQAHRRIVFMIRHDHSKPYTRPAEIAFLDEMNSLGIATSNYHLPNWGDEIAGFHRCLERLFRHTPPTALILDEAPLYIAAQKHLARLGKIAPRDISLISNDPDTAFSWCDPPISHVRWDVKHVIQHVVRWADGLAQAKDDRQQFSVLAEFVEGGTIGPAKR